MSRLMQMPGLHIRGSIATQTMSGLSREQINEIDKIVREIRDDYALAPDKHEFIKQLGATIGGDYKSDISAASQEFDIAIWRATAYLLFHRSYNYICSLCGATEHNGEVFDRAFLVCPHCRKTLYHGRVANYHFAKKRYWVEDEEGNQLVEVSAKLSFNKLVISPIRAVHGEQKINNPHEILKDKNQRSKWYSTWIWNYFRQILLENTIRVHNKQKVEISGPADYIAFCIISNYLKLNKYKHQTSEYGSEYTICVNILATVPEFSYMLSALMREYAIYGISFTICNNSISVKKRSDAPFTSALIETNQTVSNISIDTPCDTDSDEGNWTDTVEFNSGDTYDGNLSEYISDEAMRRVRGNLTDEKAKLTFDILSQSGIGWQRYSDEWGSGPAKKSTLAKFLEVSPKQIEAYKQTIAQCCLLGGLVN